MGEPRQALSTYVWPRQTSESDQWWATLGSRLGSAPWEYPVSSAVAGSGSHRANLVSLPTPSLHPDSRVEGSPGGPAGSWRSDSPGSVRVKGGPGSLLPSMTRVHLTDMSHAHSGRPGGGNLSPQPTPYSAPPTMQPRVLSHVLPRTSQQLLRAEVLPPGSAWLPHACPRTAAKRAPGRIQEERGTS